MTPKWVVFLQGVAVLLFAIAAMIVLQERAADTVLALCGVGALIWTFFGVSYYFRRRKGQGATLRSEHRRKLDQMMMVCFAIGLGLPVALALMDIFIGPLSAFRPPLRGGQAVILTLCVCAVPVSMFVSSSVDWYLMRAFRDGVFGAPACQAEQLESGRSIEYARYWVMHRFVSEGIVFLAIIGAIAEITAICTGAIHRPASQNAFNDIGIVGIIAWSYSSLAKLRPAIDFLRFPTDACALGHWQAGRNDEGVPIQGLCLDVSLDPGIQLIERPRGYKAPDISDPERSVPLKMRRTLKRTSPPDTVRDLCSRDKCEFWIQHCERGNRQKESEDGSANDATGVG